MLNCVGTTGYHCAAADITPTPMQVVSYEYRVNDPSTISALEHTLLRKVAEGLGLTACSRADRVRSIVTGVSLEPRDSVVEEESCGDATDGCSVLVKGGMTIFLDSDEYKKSTVNDFFWAVLHESLASTASSSSPEGSGMILVENLVLVDGDDNMNDDTSREVSSPFVTAGGGDFEGTDGSMIPPESTDTATSGQGRTTDTSTGNNNGSDTGELSGSNTPTAGGTGGGSNDNTNGNSNSSTGEDATSTGARNGDNNINPNTLNLGTFGDSTGANTFPNTPNLGIFGDNNSANDGGGETANQNSTPSNVAGSNNEGGSTVSNPSASNTNAEGNRGGVGTAISDSTSLSGGESTTSGGTGGSAANNGGGGEETSSASSGGSSGTNAGADNVGGSSSSNNNDSGTSTNPLNDGSTIGSSNGIPSLSPGVTMMGPSSALDSDAATLGSSAARGPRLAAIIGGTLGGVGLLLCLCCCCCCYMWRRRRRNPNTSLVLSPQSSNVSGVRALGDQWQETTEADGNGQLASLDSLAAKDRGTSIFTGEQTEEDTTSGGDEEEGIYVTDGESLEEVAALPEESADGLSGTGYISGGGYDSDIHFDSDVEGLRVATVDVDDLMTSDDGGATTDDDAGALTDDSAPQGSRRRGLLQALDETSTNTSSYDEEIMGVLGHVPSPSADSEDNFSADMDRSAESPRTELQMT